MYIWKGSKETTDASSKTYCGTLPYTNGGYIGNNITWNDFIGVIPVKTDSTSDKYFKTEFKCSALERARRKNDNIFGTTFDLSDNNIQFPNTTVRMTYKR